MLKKILISFIFMMLAVGASAAEFSVGKDYEVISGQTSRTNKGLPSVIEFFSYGCPWCYRIDEEVNGWINKMGKNVTFQRVPVVFKPEWELYAKAFYTAKTLALSHKLDPLLFKAVQENGLNSTSLMINFFVAQGVDKEIAKSAFENSTTIDMRIREAMALMAAYQISAVPAFVVNNKYKTDLQKAGSPERLFIILDYLLKKA